MSEISRNIKSRVVFQCTPVMCSSYSDKLILKTICSCSSERWHILSESAYFPISNYWYLLNKDFTIRHLKMVSTAGYFKVHVQECMQIFNQGCFVWYYRFIDEYQEIFSLLFSSLVQSLNHPPLLLLFTLWSIEEEEIETTKE